jgi:Zn-dependent metalloprotease
MRTITQHVCGVIPPHILTRVAERTDHTAHEAARTTLEQMRELATDRARTFLDRGAAAKAEPPKKRRSVYDAHHAFKLPGKLVTSEHKPRSGDAEINEAYNGSGVTFDFFAAVFGRNSIDNRGLRIDSTVHYGTQFDNAMWTGHQLVFGDGDGHLFNRFTASLDVIGHELTHGVTQYTAALGYTGQNGALNEHISDAFGIMVKQYTLGQAASASDWLIGATLLTPRVHGKAIRSMAAPGTAYDDPVLGRDPQPAHMRDYVDTSDDHGGVHINSGIPNHAFYLAAIALGGRTWEVLGRIWYVTLTSRLRPDADFGDFVRATVDVAGELYGNGGRVQRIVADAWGAVGIGVRLLAGVRIPVSRPATRAVRPHKAAKWRRRPAY